MNLWRFTRSLRDSHSLFRAFQNHQPTRAAGSGTGNLRFLEKTHRENMQTHQPGFKPGSLYEETVLPFSTPEKVSQITAKIKFIARDL